MLLRLGIFLALVMAVLIGFLLMIAQNGIGFD
jgi:hypothetical protein